MTDSEETNSPLRLNVDNFHQLSDSLNWIYKIRKDKLIEACSKMNIEVTGQKVADLRKALSSTIKQHRLSKSTENLFDEIEKEIKEEEEDIIISSTTSQPERVNNFTSLTPMPATNTRYDQNTSPVRSFDDSKLSSQIQTWNLAYRGNDDLYAFLSKVEGRAENLKIPTDSLVPYLPQLLIGPAQQWYDVQGRNIQTWEQFRQEIAGFFLPTRFLSQIENTYYNRRQRPREKARDFILDLLTLARQHPKLKFENHLDRLYDGLLPEYRLQITRNSVQSISELSTKCNEYEQLKIEEQRSHRNEEQRRDDRRPRQANHMIGNYKRSTHCWKCGQEGHNRHKCPNKPILFCSHCGKHNVLSSHCKGLTPGGITATDRFYVKIKIKTFIFTALVDTGATQSFVSQGTMETLVEAGFQAQDHYSMLQVADKNVIHTKHRFHLPMEFNNHLAWQYLIVMPTLAERMILGMDFLNQRRIGLTINGKPIPTLKGPSRIYHPSPVARIFGIVSHQELVSQQQQELDSFIQDQKNRFNNITGPCKIATHVIKVKHDQPIKQRYYPRNPAMQKVIDEEIDSLLETGRIEPSKSAYSSPIVLVRKKQGTWRMCIDYRQLNTASIPDAYPLPQIQAILDQLKEATIISSIDLKNGYWQIPLETNSRKFTAFTVPGRGLYQWKVMPFGLHSAPATFQRALDSLIGPELHPRVFAYLDDIIITGRTYEEHLENLKIVCDKLYEANMQLNFEKSDFARRQVRYLGHVVSAEGIHTDPDKIEAIQKMPTPTTIKEVRRCIGIASWYRRFIPNFSRIIAPLTTLLKKDQKFVWGEEQITAFQDIKDKLTSAPILHCPDYSLPFVLQTDASNLGLGAVLFQRHSDQEQVIAYASRTLSPTEKNYSTTEQECLAILWGIRKMRPYLEGYHFTVITDHHSLKWLHQLQNPSGRLARWALEMQQYDFNVEYRKGTTNVVADTLSRSPLPMEKYESLFATSHIPPEDWTTKKIVSVTQSPDSFPDFQVIEGRLFKHFLKKNLVSTEVEWKLCVPKDKQMQVLHEVHDSLSAGHLGIAKTLHRARQYYYWPGMYRDVLRYVQRCRQCNQFKPSQQKPAGLMTTTQCCKPWEMVCADFVGPLPRSTNGHTCLLVLVDKFSRWVELLPVRKATAKTIIYALREKIIYRHGCPKLFLSDNGRQFVSKELKSFLEEHNITHRFTAPYSPQENPTERTNRIIKTMIAQLCGNSHKNWDKYLPEITFALNTATRETTGQSAAQIIFGRNPVPPNQVRNEGPTPDEPQTPLNMPKLWEQVQTAAQKASQNQQKYFNKNRRQWQPKIGDQVYKKEHPLSSATRNFAQKLAPKYSGPYQISKYN